jgi:shikimate O-hydroxycinnamoyltransferase
METMDVQVQRTLVIPEPPAQPTEEVPFTVFDRVAPTYHVTVLFAFAAPNPTAAALIDALAATLPRFPILTARIDRCRPAFVTGGGGAGALVVETAVGSALADVLPLAPSPGLARLHVALDDKDRLLQVQINRFACGGLVVASSAHHQAADGYSMSTFFNAWVDAVRAAANAQQQPAAPRPPVRAGGTGASPPAAVRVRAPRRRVPAQEGRPAEEAKPGPRRPRRPVRDRQPDAVLRARIHIPAQGHNTPQVHHLRDRVRAPVAEDHPVPRPLNVSVNGRVRLGPDSIAYTMD